MSTEVKAPELFTERLRLSDMTEEDAPFVVEWRSDPDVYRFFVSPHKITLEEHLNWFRTRYRFDNDRYDWVAFSKENEPVGIFGARREDEHSETAEVSYILSPKHYGKGYAGEAVERIIAFCREQWECVTVIAEIHKNNIRSLGFIKRLGFELQSENGDFVIYSRKI